MLSHELRTPLNAIIGFSGLIREKLLADNEDDHAEYAEMVEQSGHALLNRVEGMLNWTQIQRGEMELNDSQVDLLKMLDDCQKALPELSGQEPAPQIKVIYPEDCPFLICDRDQISHAFVNILRNAIQSSATDTTIAIDIQVENGLSIALSDQGSGMSPESLERALAAFEHADDNPLHTHNGLGLGLPLSRRIAEMHGGRMDVQSVLGAGTVVTFSFPEYRLKLN